MLKNPSRSLNKSAIAMNTGISTIRMLGGPMSPNWFDVLNNGRPPMADYLQCNYSGKSCCFTEGCSNFIAVDHTLDSSCIVLTMLGTHAPVLLTSYYEPMKISCSGFDMDLFIDKRFSNYRGGTDEDQIPSSVDSIFAAATAVHSNSVNVRTNESAFNSTRVKVYYVTASTEAADDLKPGDIEGPSCGLAALSLFQGLPCGPVLSGEAAISQELVTTSSQDVDCDRLVIEKVGEIETKIGCFLQSKTYSDLYLPLRNICSWSDSNETYTTNLGDVLSNFYNEEECRQLEDEFLNSFCTNSLFRSPIRLVTPHGNKRIHLVDNVSDLISSYCNYQRNTSQTDYARMIAKNVFDVKLAYQRAMSVKGHATSVVAEKLSRDEDLPTAAELEGVVREAIRRIEHPDDKAKKNAPIDVGAKKTKSDSNARELTLRLAEYKDTMKNISENNAKFTSRYTVISKDTNESIDIDSVRECFRSLTKKTVATEFTAWEKYWEDLGFTIGFAFAPMIKDGTLTRNENGTAYVDNVRFQPPSTFSKTNKKSRSSKVNEALRGLNVEF